eukprot:502009_1
MATGKPILGVPSTMNDSYQLNVRKLFERGCLLQPESEIVARLLPNGTERITYRQLQQRATKIASILTNNYNINIGDRIGTFMWTHIRHALLCYAIPSMGSIFNPINFRLHPKELGFIINHSKHKIIFIDEDLIPFFSKIPMQYLTHVKYFIICGGNDGQRANNLSLKNANYNQQIIDFISFENETVYKKFTWPELDERNGAYLLYTSGTTGNPKGSLYGHRSTYIHLLNFGTTDVFGCSGADCILTLVPMFHVLGGLLPLMGFMLGFKQLLPGRCNDYGQILDFCLTEQCTVISGVPTVMQSFRQALRNNPNKYIGIRGVLTRALCGGSSPPSDLIKWFWNHYKIELIQGWGMSETGGFAYMSRRCARRSDLLLTDDEKGQNSLVPGIPFPSIHGKIKIDKLNKNNDKQMGEWYVNGPIVTTRYYGIETPDKFDENGWLKTGDIVSYTNKQQMVIHDRSKDMIKSGGEWISSSDMETFIAAKFSKEIDKCCVVGAYHEIFRERPIVIIELYNKNDKTVSKEMIMEHLMTKYANFQLPDDIVFWDEIPLTGTGKMSKKDVRIKI